MLRARVCPLRPAWEGRAGIGSLVDGQQQGKSRVAGGGSGHGVQAGDHGTQVNIISENNFARLVANPVVPVAGGPVVVGEVPQEPVAFQPRAGLLAGLEVAGPDGRVVVVRAVTGMRGVGKTHLAAEYARARLAEQWRLVAWINAEEPAGVLAGLVAVAGTLGLGAADGEAAGRAVRHWLETGGERCLLVFDNATDPAVLRPFIPAAGGARVIITSNEQSMRYLGASLPVEVFTQEEALAFLAERTGMADSAGAGLVAAELGYLPLALALALAQAAAVIAGQRIGYSTYLARLRALPIGEMLRAEEAGQYPRGVAAVLLSVEGARAEDDTGAAAGVIRNRSRGGFSYTTPADVAYPASGTGRETSGGRDCRTPFWMPGLVRRFGDRSDHLRRSEACVCDQGQIAA